MRLRQIRKIIDENINQINYQSKKINQTIAEISDYQKAIDAIENLSEFKFIQKEYKKLIKLENIYYNKSNSDKVRINHRTKKEFSNIIKMINQKCRTVLDLIDEAIPKQNKNSISIKLPDYKDLSRISDFFKNIDNILNQSLVNEKINGKIKLQNFDTGSQWVEVIVGSAAALNFVAGLCWAAAVIRKKHFEAEILERQVQALDIKNDALKSISSGLEKEINSLVEIEAKNLLEKEKMDYDNEYFGKIKYSIKTLGKLMFEGTEIHHSLTAPEEAKNLFPDYSKIDLINSSIKKIDSKKSE